MKTTCFYYEDGQGKLVDEEGNDAIDWVEEATPFHLRTLTRITEYCRKQEEEGVSSEDSLGNLDADMEEVIAIVKKQKRLHHKYSNEQKLTFVYYNRIKLFNTAKSGCLAGGIAKRTAQKWAKKLKEDKDWNIFEKQTNLVNRLKPQLDERHKVHLLECYNNCPQAQVLDAMESLTQKFSDLTVKKSTVHNFLKNECNLSFKKLTHLPVARNNSDKIQARKNWVIKWTATDMNYLENCVFVDESAFDRNMRPPSEWSVKGTPAITTTPTTKAVSHTVLGAISTKFVVAIELRNPQEESSKRIKIVHSGSKRKAPTEKKKKSGATRIAEACNNIPPEHLNAFAQHSGNCFDICLRGDPL
ncbi:hypothetical protein PHYBLDRAFT_170276 [Phycomyces blakesleeanus NRRL 1555(-)]|uniref:Homeodomain-like DNA binding domain-containing transcription factor n=1 Tax=Phycomyces blakesleeanus (strain ATCC 8743b / DSM 1359 / FGSC 10004 / NBRC 33097 / NRRL 1555) TaxID=763407 RepID=A0A162TWV0_PHYB8|nr:hypothetical protein PHYBLDRAFT_170273 [Phycomyces blakesleeanus NRRL 1555(-)]XP_018289655.1 hypothetical protein PHYBLDRAFT_170276 [Phycomyces blakesleeanus NRRL 1555(-)]OAD71612.1 hypothetical protein PHYBLDRAFT_170273 [Phycomyces blakesleeanus NRRL 1555(-)]OAD71615.1 hypothetical protein PHYBLDRAFT_170276 [Phycomyces blakesleeanus NRRL 1555(-)]|eukprot:XP_018289652.1 hypothetical protein PHYBLDRAFT_170273 [Phycomyces blakesleeanus NRRL 1555(-)]